MLPAPVCFRQPLTQPCRAFYRNTGRMLLLEHPARFIPRNTLPFHQGRRLGSNAGTQVPSSPGNVSNVSPEKRLQNLGAIGFTEYPRAPPILPPATTFDHTEWEEQLLPGESKKLPGGLSYTIVGRVSSIRTAGSKLLFVDLVEPSHETSLQIVVDNGKLPNSNGNVVKEFKKLIQRGDLIVVKGNPYRTSTGQLSLLAVQTPELLSPCLHQVPDKPVGDDSDYAQDRHVQLLTDPSVLRTIAARSKVFHSLHSRFQHARFTNVQTPILAAAASGATARPFETVATEFADRKLALRIAPELWLKKLIIGGFQKIYEIGPSFRNEGLDKTHNPEFYTCEFYAVNWNLAKLQDETRRLIHDLTKGLDGAQPDVSEGRQKTKRKVPPIPAIVDSTFRTSIEDETWPQIDFIPALNEALEVQLPSLNRSDAREQLLDVFRQKDLPIPSKPTLPRLLDKLSSIYLEPSCNKATWIVNTPECLSPLAKSIPHPDLPDQIVAARAELFIHHKEVVNCYEEENSPVEQRRKFIDQQKFARFDEKDVDDEAMKVDEDYIRALEWGLPPTGGWGCGIDRLLMLMLGKDKISDVMAFGNLRAVAKGAEKWKAA